MGLKSFLQHIHEAPMTTTGDDGPTLPDVRYPTDNPDRFPIPYPVKPGQPGYVKPTAPPGWKNPYSIPVPIKIPGVPGPGPIIPMVNPDYDRKKPRSVPAGFGGDSVNPKPFLSPYLPYGDRWRN